MRDAKVCTETDIVVNCYCGLSMHLLTAYIFVISICLSAVSPLPVKNCLYVYFILSINPDFRKGDCTNT